MRNTMQKQLIMETVKELGNHPTAEQVYDAIHAQHPHVSKATVYRNLKHLSDQGRIKRIESVSQADHYDHQCHEHYHFQCSCCKNVYDMDMEYMNDLNERMGASLVDFQIENHDILFRGICPDCLRKKQIGDIV